MHASLGQHTQHECRIMIVAVRRCSTRSRRRRPRSPLPSRHCHPLSFRHHIMSSSFQHHAGRPIVATVEARVAAAACRHWSAEVPRAPNLRRAAVLAGLGRPRLQRQAGVLTSQAGQAGCRRRAGAGQQRVTTSVVHRLRKNPARIMGAAPCGAAGVAARRASTLEKSRAHHGRGARQHSNVGSLRQVTPHTALARRTVVGVVGGRRVVRGEKRLQQDGAERLQEELF